MTTAACEITNLKNMATLAIRVLAFLRISLAALLKTHTGHTLSSPTIVISSDIIWTWVGPFLQQCGFQHRANIALKL